MMVQERSRAVRHVALVSTALAFSLSQFGCSKSGQGVADAATRFDVQPVEGPLPDRLVPDLFHPDAFAGTQWITYAETFGGGGIGGLGQDSWGNTYIAGNFCVKAVFGKTTLVETPPTGDYHCSIFVAKIDADGQFVWATNPGVEGMANAVAVDSLGNSYITGMVVSQTPQPFSFGGLSLITSSSLYVAKLDRDGKFVWVVGSGGNSSAYGRGIALESQGNIYITGDFSGGDLVLGSTKLVRTKLVHRLIHDGNMFVAKLDSNGKFIWANGAWAIGTGPANGQANGGPRQTAYGSSLAVDATGDSTVAGWFRGGKVTFGSKGLTVMGGTPTSLFVARLDTNGEFKWATGANDHGGALALYDVGLDGKGNAYVTGKFEFWVILGPAMLVGPALNAAFVAKLDSKGRFQWAKNVGGDQCAWSYGLAVENDGASFITGSYWGWAGASFGSLRVGAQGGVTDKDQTEAFVAKLDPAGKFVGLVTAGGPKTDGSWDCMVQTVRRQSATLTAVGWFTAPATFGTYTLKPKSGEGLFVWRFQL